MRSRLAETLGLALLLLGCSATTALEGDTVFDGGSWNLDLEADGCELSADSSACCDLGELGPVPEDLTPLLEDPLALRNQLLGELPQTSVPEEAQAFLDFQQRLRGLLDQVLGTSLVAPPGTPVPASLVDTLERDDHLIEKLLLEPLPGVKVPALLIRPLTSSPGALPGILVLHGHDQPGKTYTNILTLATNLGRRGAVVLLPDWYGFGDLSGDPWKHINTQGNYLAGRTMNYPATPTARRLLDYLAARPEVDPTALAATGHSGGGENTLYLGAYDQRLAATAVIDGLDDWAFRLDYGLSRCPEHYPVGFLSEGDYSTLLALHAPVPTLVLSGESDFIVSPSPVVEKLVRRAAVAYEALGAPTALRHLAFPGGHSAGLAKREAIYSFFAEVLGRPGLAGPEDGTLFKDRSDLHLKVPSDSLKTLDLVAALIEEARARAPAPQAPLTPGEFPALPASGTLEATAVAGGMVLQRELAAPLPFRVVKGPTTHLRLLCFADAGAAACLPLAGVLAPQGVEVWALDPTGFGELSDDWPVDDGWKRLRLANFLILDGRTLPLRVAADLRDLAVFQGGEGAPPVAVLGLGVKAAWLALLASALVPEISAAVALGSQTELADEYLDSPVFPMPADLYLNDYAGLGGLDRFKALAGRKPLLLDPNPDPAPLARTLCRFLLKVASL